MSTKFLVFLLLFLQHFSGTSSLDFIKPTQSSFYQTTTELQLPGTTRFSQQLNEPISLRSITETNSLVMRTNQNR